MEIFNILNEFASLISFIRMLGVLRLLIIEANVLVIDFSSVGDYMHSLRQIYAKFKAFLLCKNLKVCVFLNIQTLP